MRCAFDQMCAFNQLAHMRGNFVAVRFRVGLGLGIGLQFGLGLGLGLGLEWAGVKCEV